MGLDVGFITPKAMAKGIDLYGGEAKTDKRDLVRDSGPRRSHPLARRCRRGAEDAEELAALMSYPTPRTHRRREARRREDTNGPPEDALAATCTCPP